MLPRFIGKIIWRLGPFKRLKAALTELAQERDHLLAERDTLAAEREELLGQCRRLEAELALVVKPGQLLDHCRRLEAELAEAVGRGQTLQRINEELLVSKMRQEWDQRARSDARYYTNTARRDWSDEEYFASGETTVREYILTDMGNICQGRDPKQMRILEIGCGAGRMTRALAGVFGEVHAVDISTEMIETARRKLSDCPNVFFYVNSGKDLEVLPPLQFDFALSFIVFQHIPSPEIIENYVREVNRVLNPGSLFKFQVQGGSGVTVQPGDTWVGASFSAEAAREMAERCGFDARYLHDEGTQYFWLWFFKT